MTVNKNRDDGGFEINLEELGYKKEKGIQLPLQKGQKCMFCDNPRIDTEIAQKFKIICCTDCRYTKLKFITKTACKKEYLLTEEELDQFGYLEKPNPHKNSWSNMHLFLQDQIEEFYIEKYASLEKLEEEKKKKLNEKHKKKLNKIKKNIAKSKKGIHKIDLKQKHKHKFIQKGNKGICECGMEIEMETLQ